MILLLIWVLMRFWDMSVHKKKQQTTNRECDTLPRDSCCRSHQPDEVSLGFDCNSRRRYSDAAKHGLVSYLKGTNHFLRGLLAKLPLSQIFIDDSNNNKEQQQQQLKRAGLSISQLLAEFGSLDPEALRSELAFMGISEDFLNQDDFQWSPEYSFDDDHNEDANLLLMSASYEDMANHLDAHLAELDIDSFRAEDINSILNLKSNLEYNKTGSGFRLDNGRSRTEEEAEEDLLFSPRSGADHYLSMDSLDHEMLSGRCHSDRVRSGVDVEREEENDLIESISTNCRANKENYTLAFKDSFSGDDDSTDSQSSKGSCSIDDTKKVSWNQLGYSSNTNQSLDSSGSFVGRWNIRRSTPTKETFQLSKSAPKPAEQQNMNLVQMFMKQRTMSTSSAGESPRPTEVQTVEDFNSQSTRFRKKSMNDSGKCSTLSQHVLDEEEDEPQSHRNYHHRLLPEEDYQLDSLDVVQSEALPPPTTAAVGQSKIGLSDKPRTAAIREKLASKSIQTSKQFSQPSEVIVFPECKLPNLDFVHLEHEALRSQFVTGDQFNQLNGSHPPGFEHIVDWDSLLFLLSREHKEMLKRYPVLNEKIRNSFQDSVSDVFDDFPERIDINFGGNICDCDSLISSTGSNNSSNRHSSDSGLGPNTYNFDDLRKLFVYEYNTLDEESEGVGDAVRMRPQSSNSRHRERRATLSSMQPIKPEKKVSFEAIAAGGLPKRRTNKSTSSIPRLITSKTAPKCEKKEKVVSKIPKLIKSPSKSNVVKLL